MCLKGHPPLLYINVQLMPILKFLFLVYLKEETKKGNGDCPSAIAMSYFCDTLPETSFHMFLHCLFLHLSSDYCFLLFQQQLEMVNLSFEPMFSFALAFLNIYFPMSPKYQQRCFLKDLHPMAAHHPLRLSL